MIYIIKELLKESFWGTMVFREMLDSLFKKK